MESKRKFYKTVYEIHVLSETPGELDLEDMYRAITSGDCSGQVIFKQHKELTALEAARELMAQGSDPEFFEINERGEDVEF